jgi:hypothetical protein
MHKAFKIPAELLFATAALLAIGEVAAGTKMSFAVYVAGTLMCIGATYNILGGVSTISGIAFASFASCTIVISQFAKVILFEPADKPLESPELTIKVYFVFYLCALLGTFVYNRIRIRVPRPLEPETVAQVNLQYAISVTVGLLSSLVYEIYESSSNPSERASTAHSIGLAFSTLLLFSIVLAVQSRIRSTRGLHSFGVKAFIPWIATMFFGFIETSRAHMILPSVVYAFTCYASGYRFRWKHYVAGGLGIAVFTLVISPFEIYARGPMRELEFSGRIHEGYSLAAALPDWTIVKEASLGGAESGSREEYYQRPGTFILSRLSAIRADSNMINACAGGFHYGFTAIRIDLLRSLPRFLARNKPEIDGAAYTGRVTGVNSDEVENGETVITAVSDSYGAFGWLGVIVTALFVFPTVFILYESMFDIGKPWGIVATGGLCFQFAQVSLGGIIGLTIRVPISILLLSYVMGIIVRMIPVQGDERVFFDPEAA